MKGKAFDGRTTKPHMGNGEARRADRTGQQKLTGLRKFAPPPVEIIVRATT